MKRERIVIRKYGNRRLYNTSASRYINLEELATLVRNGNEVQVLDAKTGEDLTRITLTQIIAEDAKDDRAGLPLELLRQLIVASNSVAREGFMWFQPAMEALEGAVQSSLRRAQSALSPLEMMKKLVSPAADSPSAAEVAELKKRIAQLEKKRTAPRKKKAPRPSKAGRS